MYGERTQDKILVSASAAPVIQSSVIFRWGEVIPLLFIKDLGRTKLIIMSHPSKRYQSASAMVPEMLNLGKFCLMVRVFLQTACIALLRSSALRALGGATSYCGRSN